MIYTIKFHGHDLTVEGNVYGGEVDLVLVTDEDDNCIPLWTITGLWTDPKRGDFMQAIKQQHAEVYGND